MSHPERRHFFQRPWRSARRIQADIDEELRFELDMRTAELVREGLVEADARRQALAEFGDLEQTRRYCADLDRAGQRSERRAEWLAEVRQDVRLAWRGMRRTPAFAIVVLVTLALGLGANTAVFSVLRTVLLNRLPYHEPDRLVRLYGATLDNPDARGMLIPAEIGDMQRSRVFAAVGAFGNYSGLTYVDEQRAEGWWGVQVGPEFFHVLGVRPLLGRAIDARDVGADAVPVVVLSYGLWQRTFGGDSSIVGRTVQLSHHARTVIGVMPPTFISPDRDPEMWTPLDLQQLLRNPVTARRSRAYRAIGRLADGVTPAQLRTTLTVLASRARAQYPELHDDGPVNPVPLRDTIVGSVRPVLLVVMGAAALVLLLACVNVAGLFLSRATARRRELAVRAALGAGRARLVRQLLTESALLAIAGGAIGVGLAFWAKHMLIAVAGRALPPVGEVRIDTGVLAFAVGLSLLSALVFGLVPALTGTRFDLHGSLAESSRGASGGRASTRIGRTLVAAQMALAVVLLIGAGLLSRTLVALEHTGVGFDTSPSELTFGVNLYTTSYSDPARRAVFRENFAASLRTLPGVRTVGMVMTAPWSGPNGTRFVIGGRPEPAPGSENAAHYDVVSEDYFTALGIPVRGGRAFTSLDRDGAPLVALVSESVARQYWPGESPVGQRIRLGDQSEPWREVVGVVGDVRESPSAEVMPTVYVPLRQNPAGVQFVVRTTGDAMKLVPAIRRTLHALDPAIPVTSMQTLDEIVKSKLSGQRLPMLFTAAFAALALVLAALGVYSVMAYSVTTRRREFGIRTALGARRTSVLALVVRQGMIMTVVGTAIGLLVAAAATRVLTGMLVGVTAHDPVTFVAMPLVLLGVSVAACLIPARRATKVEPVEALRAE
jgi:predicted permease